MQPVELTPEQQMSYQAVAARRLQWDNLLWQVPILSLTAQAFLFSIALAPETSSFARIASSTLSIAVTFLCVTLMARHRQAEIVDSHWLRRFEEAHGIDRVHGEPWRKQRDATPPTTGFMHRLIPLLPGYVTWVWGLLLFGAAGACVIIVTLFAPWLLE